MKAPRSIPAQRKVVENALRDFRLAGVDLRAEEKARYREVAQRLAHLATKFSENVLDAGRAYTRSVTNERGARGPAGQCRRSRRRRCARGKSARLAVQARSAHLHDGHGQRRKRAAAPRHLRSLGHARVRAGPERRTIRQQPRHRRDPAAAPRVGALGGFRQFRRLCAGHAHGEEQQAGARLPGRLWRGAACRRHARNFRISRNSPAASSTPGTWRTTASGCRKAASRCRRRRCGRTFRCPRCLGGLFALIQRLYGISVRERPGVGVWHPSVRYYDLLDAERAAGGGVLPRSLFAHREAQRRLDGRVRRRQVPALGHGAAGGAAGVQFHRARGQRRPRC